MATVGNLFINVKAKTASFRKKMKGVRSTIGRMASGFVNIAKKAALFGAALGGIALGAVVAMTKKGLETVDTVNKLAHALNTSTEGILSLQYAASLGGVEVTALNKALMKMFANVGEASMGVGTAKRSLDEMGLSAKKLAKMDALDMFSEIAEGISKINDATRATMAKDIFGRAGIELIPTMMKGSKAIREMHKEAKALGLHFSKEQGFMVEEANDAWARIGFTWRSLSQQLAIGFAPTLELLGRVFKEFIVDAGGMGQVAEFIVLAFAKIAAAGVDAATLVQSTWLGMQASIAQVMGDVMTKMGSMVGIEMGSELDRMGQQWLITAEHLGRKFNEKWMKGWEIDKIDERLKKLKEELMERADFTTGADGTVELGAAPSLKGVIDNLQTAIGAFKVEGSVTERQQGTMIQLEKSQLGELSAIRQAVTSGGGALT